jgi:hypothetical protein
MQVIQNDAFRKQLNKGDYDADWQVKQETSHPVPVFNAKAMTQPKDKRRPEGEIPEIISQDTFDGARLHNKSGFGVCQIF